MPLTLMFFVFLGVVLLVLGGIHAFLYRGLVGGLRIESRGARWVLRVALFVLAISYPLTRWLDGFAPEPIVVAAHWIASLWIGAMFHLFWIGVLLWLVKTLLRLTGLWRRLERWHARLGRLAVWSTIGAALVLCVLGVFGARAPAVVRLARVPVAGYTPELGALRIALVADLHAGVLVDRAFVERRVAELEALRPDLVLIPGDVLDHPPERIEETAAVLAGLDAPLGVFASTGNHEYIVGIERSRAFLERAGLRVLSNERVELACGLVLAGIEDAMAERQGLERPSFAELLGPEASREPVILLNHTPARAESEAAAAAGADLVVSGHTHGGQIWPFRYLTRLAFPLNHGLYELKGGGRQLTTCGIGFWGPPMRLGAPPEIWLVELVAR